MSTSSATAPTLEPTPQKEIPALTDAYRKAHKTYVLASGLLASWELIGITLQTKEKWGLELKSPAAVPLILFTLVIYSGYKMTIEWLQCDLDRQKNPAAKLDYRIAHGIAFIAIWISFIQYLLRIQIVDVLLHHTLAVGNSIMGLCLIGTFWALLFPHRLPLARLYWIATLMILLGTSIAVLRLRWADNELLVEGCVLIAGGLLCGFLIHSTIKQRMGKHSH